MKRPKAPKPTAQQLAVERRQAAALDEEIAEQEERSRALTRGRLGTASLLAGVPGTRGAPRATSQRNNGSARPPGGFNFGNLRGINIGQGR